MRAVTLEPRRPGSLRLEDIPEAAAAGALLVRARAVGICGTDRELIDGHYGGHESLGHVVDAPPHSPFRIGDTVVGIVRNPDPLPCSHCAVGEWEADGFAAELFGLLAALLGMQRGLEVQVQDHNERGPKPGLVADLGARYSTAASEGDFDVIMSNRRHYAAAVLARAERSWLERLVTRKVPLRDWRSAYEKRPGDVKTVILFED